MARGYWRFSAADEDEIWKRGCELVMRQGRLLGRWG
jgi:hypothetical protein